MILPFKILKSPEKTNNSSKQNTCNLPFHYYIPSQNSFTRFYDFCQTHPYNFSHFHTYIHTHTHIHTQKYLFFQRIDFNFPSPRLSIHSSLDLSVNRFPLPLHPTLSNDFDFFLHCTLTLPVILAIPSISNNRPVWSARRGDDASERNAHHVFHFVSSDQG